jgi:hypothetical protein
MSPRNAPTIELTSTHQIDSIPNPTRILAGMNMNSPYQKKANGNVAAKNIPRNITKYTICG